MKPRNAALGSWEPRVDRQDTHSGLKRHEDKGGRTRKAEGGREITCFLSLRIYSMRKDRSWSKRERGLSLRQVLDSNKECKLEKQKGRTSASGRQLYCTCKVREGESVKSL